MELHDSHISDKRIRDFAYGNLILEPGELIHFQSCDQCSSAWWKLRQEAKREEAGRKDKSA